MDIMRARVALRERSFLDVLDLTTRFVFSHKAAYAKLALIVLLPALVVSYAFALWAGWIWGWLAVLACASFAQAPFTALASRLVFEEKVAIKEVVGAAARRLPTLFGARLVHLLAVGGASLALILPALWVGSIMFFLVEVIVLEQASATTAFGRSSRIAGTRLGDAMLAFMVLGVFPLGMPLLADAAGRTLLQDFLQVRPPASIWSEGGGWLPLLGFWFGVPFLATARLFVYLDFRTRSEGWDIQTKFAAIAHRAQLEQEEPPLSVRFPGRVHS